MNIIETWVQSCAPLIKWAHAAASLRVVPPPRNERGNTKRSRVSLGVDVDDDEVLVAPSQCVMTWHGNRREGATLGTHAKVCAFDRADAECVGRWGDREGATPGAREGDAQIRDDEWRVHEFAAPGACANAAPPDTRDECRCESASPGRRANATSLGASGARCTGAEKASAGPLGTLCGVPVRQDVDNHLAGDEDVLAVTPASLFGEEDEIYQPACHTIAVSADVSWEDAMATPALFAHGAWAACRPSTRQHERRPQHRKP